MQVDHPHCMKLYAVYDEPDKTMLVLELIQALRPLFAHTVLRPI